MVSGNSYGVSGGCDMVFIIVWFLETMGVILS
jgi:hypothetical protein